jgi:hypothetical protein
MVFELTAALVGVVIGLFVAKQLVLKQLRVQWKKEGSRY